MEKRNKGQEMTLVKGKQPTNLASQIQGKFFGFFFIVKELKLEKINRDVFQREPFDSSNWIVQEYYVAW